MDTFEKVKEFLEDQKDHIYKSKISKDLNINSNTVNLIISKLELIVDEKGRIKLC